MAYATDKATAQAFADRSNASDAGKRKYELVRARVDLYGADQWQVSVYELQPDGGYAFNHQALIS